MTEPTTQMPVLLTPRPGLLACGQPGADAWDALARAGVRTVVNLRPGAEQPDRDEGAEVRAVGLVYVHIPVDGAAGLTRDAALALYRTLTEAPSSILVHCGSANRVGALLALADAWYGSGEPQAALALGRDAGMGGLEPVVRALLGVREG